MVVGYGVRECGGGGAAVQLAKALPGPETLACFSEPDFCGTE